jgi:hypothetical protein
VNIGRLSTICFLLFFVALFAAIPLIQVSPEVAIAAAVVAILSSMRPLLAAQEED